MSILVCSQWSSSTCCRASKDEFRDLIFRNEALICSHHLPGKFDRMIEVIDGAGGKAEFPLTIHVLEEMVDGGSAEWLDPIASADECKALTVEARKTP